VNTFFMGVDVSKGYADFIILGKNNKVVEKTFQLDDTFDGHSVLTNFLSDFFIQTPKSKLIAAVESTGGYEDNWYSLLLRLGEIYPLKVARLNPLVVKKHHEALMNRNVTDSISAENIASYLSCYPDKITYEQDVNYNRLCRQWNCTQLLLKQRTQLLNQLNSLMYQSNPELLRYCKQSVPNWILDILTLYPTSNKLAKARPVTLAKIPSVTLEKAQSISLEAKKSIAAHVSETDEFMMLEIVKQIRHLGPSIENQKQHLRKNCALPEVDLLCSFKGISVYSALGLLINIVSITRFPTIKHLVSYFGLHPVYKQSGDGSWGYHMSKQGRKQPRAILFMVALSASAYNPIVKQLYQDCIAKGMKKMAAIGVCMHKILRIVYGMLKTNKSFDPKIDEKNRSKIITGSKKKRVNKKRRFQSNDKRAPISRRQTNTRKKMEVDMEPQRIINPKNGVIQSLPKLNIVPGRNQKQRKNDLQQLGQVLVDAMIEYEGNKK